MRHLNRLPQLRVAVNSRCGRLCFYCRPSGEGLSSYGKDELTIEEVVAVCRAAARLGVQDFKLTGGDPALWDPLVETVRRLKHEIRAPQVHVISRHPRVGELAPALAAAGVDLLNISLDTLDPVLHRDITGQDDLPLLLDAIRHCSAAGVTCKVNMVVMEGINDHEIEAIIRFCEDAQVRSLKLLDVIRDLEDGAETYANRLFKLRGRLPSETYMPLAAFSERLRATARQVDLVRQGGLGHPMTRILLASGLEVVVKDHLAGAWYGSVCAGCRHYKCHDALMALRLTADARLQFCLLNEDVAVDLKPCLSSRDANELQRVMHQALSVYDEATFEGPNDPTEIATLVGGRLLPLLPI